MATVMTYTGGSVQTTDATQTTIITIPISADNKTVYLDARVIGCKSDNTQRHVTHITGLFYRDGGNTTQQGATVSLNTTDSGDGYSVAFVAADATNVYVKVTGKAGTTVNWEGICIWHYEDNA